MDANPDGPSDIEAAIVEKMQAWMAMQGEIAELRKQWRDGRAGFVISSPDDPGTQAAFAAGRGWPFRMVSLAQSRFAQDMGFADDAGNYMPGYSTFRRGEDGQVRRVSNDFFGPGDLYCGVWHLFDNLVEGPAGWYPRFDYSREVEAD